MNIGIVTSYNSKNPAGLERFLIELIKNLKLFDKQNQYIIYTNKNSDINVAMPVIKIGFGKLWKHIGLLFASKADTYIFNGPIIPLFFSPKNYFLIIYDFAYKYVVAGTFRERIKNFIMDALTNLAIKRAKKIIVISEATKRDLIKFFNVAKDKIVVVYPGFSDFSKILERPIKNINQKFFLFVGTIKERKNPIAVIKAFSVFNKNYNNEFGLILAGKLNSESDYFKKIIEFLKNENLGGRVWLTNHVSDNELAFLYKNATALVFPSLIEGFGFPVLEAMSCGLPVITSNISSLPEVAGQAALLVNPRDEEEVSRAMTSIVNDSNLRQKLINEGFQQVQKFKWENMAMAFKNLIISD